MTGYSTMDDKLAALLLAHREESLSGEAISRTMGVTRSAVWKGMERLRRAGWEITSATNRGYRLARVPDLVTAPVVESFLPRPRTAPIFTYDELDSTITQGQRMVLEGAENGAVIIADRQTMGAGRMGRSFLSPGGVGIYLSYLLAPGCGGGSLGLLTSCAGLAVCDAISACTGLTPRIKWPNDIILDRRKVCGILTRLVSDGEDGSISWAIIGIGINVSQDSFPEELADKAISVRMAGGDVLRARLAAELISRLDGIFSGAGWQGADPSILDRLRSLSCTLGRQVVVTSPLGRQEGEALDIAPDGSLLVRFPDGTRPVNSGEVSVRGVLGYT